MPVFPVLNWTFLSSHILAQCLKYDNQQINTREFKDLAYTLRVPLAHMGRIDYKGHGWRQQDWVQRCCGKRQE